MYSYFISYDYRDGTTQGTGNVQMFRKEKISDMECIKSASRQIEKDLKFNEHTVVILNFRLFDEP